MYSSAAVSHLGRPFMPGHLRRSILRILVLNSTHEISWSRSGFFSLRGRILRAGPPGPPLFSCFCFLLPSCLLRSPGPPTVREIKNAPPGERPTSRDLMYFDGSLRTSTQLAESFPTVPNLFYNSHGVPEPTFSRGAGSSCPEPEPAAVHSFRRRQARPVREKKYPEVLRGATWRQA